MANINEVNQRIKKLTKQLEVVNEFSTRQSERLLAGIYRQAYKDITAELGTIWTKYADTQGVLTRAEMFKYDRWTSLQDNIQRQLRSMNASLTASTDAEIYRQFRTSYYGNGYMFESTLNVGLGFSQINHNAMIASLNQYYDFKTWKESYKTSTNAIYTKVKNQISLGMVKGNDYATTARGIQEYFNNGFNDAKRIVRTETHRARAVAVLDSQKQLMSLPESEGLEMVPFWIAAIGDGKTRDDHFDADGSNPDADGYYWLGPDRTEGPGLSGVLGQDINCRCGTGTEFKGAKGKESLTRHARYHDVGGGGRVPYQTASEWKNSKKITNVPKKRNKSKK